MSQNIIKREIKMYSNLKENQNSKNQNLWHLTRTIRKDKGWHYMPITKLKVLKSMTSGSKLRSWKKRNKLNLCYHYKKFIVTTNEIDNI